MKLTDGEWRDLGFPLRLVKEIRQRLTTNDVGKKAVITTAPAVVKKTVTPRRTPPLPPPNPPPRPKPRLPAEAGEELPSLYVAAKEGDAGVVCELIDIEGAEGMMCDCPCWM